MTSAVKKYIYQLKDILLNLISVTNNKQNHNEMYMFDQSTCEQHFIRYNFAQKNLPDFPTNYEKKQIISVESALRIERILHDIEIKKDITIDSISFSGGGYNCVYHLGVIRYIFDNIDLFKGTKYLGASGGAGIISIILCYEKDPDRMYVLDTILKEIMGLNNANLRLYEQVEKYSSIVETYITEDKFNANIKDTDRCHISVTDITGYLSGYLPIPKNSVKTDFKTYKQFMDTLKASACIPFILDNKVRTIDDGRYLDGGLSNNLPTLDEKTVRISCLNYPFLRADLYPEKICKLSHAFIAPDKDYILNMHDLGYIDMENYMHEKQKYLESTNDDKKLNTLITNIIDDPHFTD